MSEYQFYEFKSIDRSLTPKEKEVISSWSSRTLVTNTEATFTYHYSDFPQDELKVVEKYFDAMFYITNWGSRRLIFKIPNDFVVNKKIKQYRAEGVEIYDYEKFTLIDIRIEDEEGEYDWIEGEGILTSLITLRDDVISGDYRCLYLIWLKVSTEGVMNGYGSIDEESEEPDVPEGLKELNGSLSEFVSMFDIDEDIITAASAVSEPSKLSEKIDYLHCVEKLTHKEKNEWLVRLIKNESQLSEKLKRRFASHSPGNRQTPKRTVSSIVENALLIKKERKAKEKSIQEEKRLARLRNIEEKESPLWDEVYSLIKQKKTKAYDEAIQLLQSLKELAVHKDRLAEFNEKVTAIKEANSNLSALKWRIENAKLFDA